MPSNHSYNRYSPTPFGSVMLGRDFSGGMYRFGNGGQEKTDEISGSGNHTTAMFWGYDTRLGRRWNQDPKPNPSISNYSCFANNPIWFSDVNGDTIVVTGDRANDFLTKLNNESCDLFKLNEKNQLLLKNPDAILVGVFANKMADAISNTQTVTFKTISESDQKFADNFQTAEVDVDDLNNISGTLYFGTVLHFTVERFAIKDYDKNRKGISLVEFNKAHLAGADAEAELFKEAFPDKKNIKYKSEGWDQSSLKLNPDGMGTKNYVFNFGDVKKVYVQPVKKDGTIPENIVPEKSSVVPNK